MLIHTIGHSTRTIEEFIGVLKHYGIGLVADVRHFPASRKFPWFKKEELEKSLNEAGINYLWLEKLGGFRKGGYLEYTKAKEYEEGIKELLEAATVGRAAIMCAEILWFRCHRKHISETLAGAGHRVVHIYDKKRAEEHKSKEAEEQMRLKVFCNKVKE